MSVINLTYPSGSTPLDPDELNGLIPDYITTQGELNTLEKENIKEAIIWSTRRKHKDLLEINFAYSLHKRMFGDVWKWAGTQRHSNKSIGIDWPQISVQLRQLLDDTKYWIENQTYPWQELAARFHHRLVQIHIFPNGNGRHARLMTELIMQNHDQSPPTWGAHSLKDNLDVESEIRNEYIRSLKKADHRKLSCLIKFMFS